MPKAIITNPGRRAPRKRTTTRKKSAPKKRTTRARRNPSPALIMNPKRRSYRRNPAQSALETAMESLIGALTIGVGIVGYDRVKQYVDDGVIRNLIAAGVTVGVPIIAGNKAKYLVPAALAFGGTALADTVLQLLSDTGPQNVTAIPAAPAQLRGVESAGLLSLTPYKVEPDVKKRLYGLAGIELNG